MFCSLLALLSTNRLRVRVLLAVVTAFGLIVASDGRAATGYPPKDFTAGSLGVYYSTEDAACSAAAAAAGTGYTGVVYDAAGPTRSCQYKNASGQNASGTSVRLRCADGTTITSTYKAATRDTFCSTAPPPDCAGTLLNKYRGAGVTGPSLTDQAPGLICVQGCGYAGGSLMVTFPKAGGGYTYSGRLGAATGQACTTANYDVIDTVMYDETKDVPPSPLSCADQGKVYGTVNGVGVCAGPGSIPGSKVNITDTKTTQNTDASGVQAAPQTETWNYNIGNINGVSVVVATVTHADGTKTQTTGSLDGFCKDNPTVSFCGGGGGGKGGGKNGDSMFSGGCGSGFSCNGDAIQCAMAKEQYKRNCEAEAADPARDLFTTEAAKDQGRAGVIAATGGMQTVDVGDKLNNVTDRFGSGACPAPLVFRPLDTLVEISFQPVCDYAPWIRAVVLLCTALFCARILFGYNSKG